MAGGAFRFAGRIPRSNDHTVSRVPTKTCPTLQQGCKDQGVQRQGPGVTKGSRKYAGHKCREVSPSEEGLCRVIVIAGAGAYYLEDLDERPLPRPWNVHNLKKFYH